MELRELDQLGVLVPGFRKWYYKENQTRPEGQPHFFPIIMDGKKLYETMLAKMPASVNPKPDPSEWNLDTAFEATKLGRTIKENLDEEQSRRSKRPKASPDSTRSDPGRTRRRGERRGGAVPSRDAREAIDVDASPFPEYEYERRRAREIKNASRFKKCSRS